MLPHDQGKTTSPSKSAWQFEPSTKARFGCGNLKHEPCESSTTTQSGVPLNTGSGPLSMLSVQAENFKIDSGILGSSNNQGMVSPLPPSEQFLKVEEKVNAAGIVPRVQIVSKYQNVVNHEK